MLLLFVFLIFSIRAQDSLKNIRLLPPSEKSAMSLMEALKNRKTTRNFSADKELSLQQLSDLMWAAFGINRPEKGNRTAPSAFNTQETEIWVALKSGIYTYNAKSHTLEFKSEKDIRSKCGMQPFVKDAPVVIIYVTNFSRLDVKVSDTDKLMYASADIGFISQNVYLYCASENLATVILGWVNKTQLAQELKLEKHKKVMFTQPVGYPAEK